MQPAVRVDGFGGFFRQVQVAGKHIFATHQHLAGGRVQPDLVVGRCRANGARLHLAGGHAGGRAAGFGHAPNLQHGQAQGHVPTHQVGRNGRCAGHQKARPVNANELAHVVQHQPPRQRELDLQPGAHRLPRQHALGNGGAHADAPGVGGLLDHARFFEGNHHTRIKLFPYPGHGREYGGGNLAHVFRNGLGVFDEVEFGPRVQRKVLAPHALGDVAQRQKAHPLVALILRHQRVVAAHGEHQTLVQMHGALGLAGGARGVDQDGQVFGFAHLHPLFDCTGMLLQVAPPQCAQCVQADDAGVVQLPQALHVKHDNFAQQG